MANGGKLTKIKSVLKRMQSFKLGRGGANASSIAAANTSSNDDSCAVARDLRAVARDLRAVYVGKSRRRYLLSSDVTSNPLFRQLVDRHSDGVADREDSISVVGCEVVLFEHLLWMLENADPQPDSLNDLVDFYVC